MDALLFAYACLASLGVLQGLLFTLHLFENRRFARARSRNPDEAHCEGHVQLFAPCKGHDTGLRGNLGRLLEQDHPDYEVTFIVESAQDPAMAIIRDVIAAHPHVPASIHVAGLATDCGQKVHNLRAATSTLSTNTTVLAFVDSDARPSPGWLRHLAARLDRPTVGAISGYRWFVPERPTLSNYLLSNINAAVAGLIGPGGHQFVWGGSWAIRREVFERVKLRDAWRGTLSDDLVATKALKHAGMEIHFEPKCLVASPVDTDLPRLFEFLRRQFVVARFYSRRWWAGAIAVSLLSSGAIWGSVILAAYWSVTGHRAAVLAATMAAALWLMHTVRAYLRQDIARFCLPSFKSQLAGCRSFDVLAAPICGLVSLGCLLSSLIGRTIVWRGIAYRLRSGGQIESLSRIATEVVPRQATPGQERRAA
jgi:hypothetical protein